VRVAGTAEGGRPAHALEARGLRVAFKGLVALDGVDLHLDRGEILGLIGPNGAGKTTLANAVSGYQRPSEGEVFFEGSPVTGMPPHRLGRRGLARTFQAVRVFGRLTVAENVEAAAVASGRGRRSARKLVRPLLERMELTALADRPAGALAYGDERRVSIARALAMEPKVLLLDEPAAGLNDEETFALCDTITDIRREWGCGVLVIEHDMRLIMRVCERLQVLAEGRTIAIGTPESVREDPQVIEAYLGTEDDHAAA
jgi:branched-chain amino acid transport system ATP-binding protein